MDSQALADITDRLLKEIAVPGSNLRSLVRHLREREGCSEAEAAELAGAVCRKLDAERLPPITQLELMVTEDCNHRCHYCFVEGKNVSHRMSRETARQAVDFLIAQSRKETELTLLLFGGEPLLEYDLLRELLPYAIEQARAAGKKMKFDMTTNATLLDEERIRFLVSLGVKILVSLDGDRETHDRHRLTLDGKSSYDRVRDNLPRIKRYQPWLGTRMTVHPDTVVRISRNVAHLASLGVNQFIIGAATGLEWTEESLDLYRDEMIRVASWLKKELSRGGPFRVTHFEENLQMMSGRRGRYGCRAGRHCVSVTSEGEIYPCSKMLGVSGLKGLYLLGTLAEGMTEIRNRLELCGMIGVKGQACAVCSEDDLCYGGCYATNFQATGSIFEPSPLECRIKRRTVEIAREAEKILGTEFYDRLSSH
ncbi:MAG: radical SAM protein [Candidatus Aureabacteria bacterium]|nr:radical SAM protein [Candidatus Auribacterota bacterium]